LMNTLKLEGAKYNIKVNTVAPLATTRLTEDVLPPDFAGKLKPEFVAPLVLYLCSEQCPASGGVYNAGMGHYSRATVVSGPGVWLDQDGQPPEPEAIAANWQRILSLSGAESYHDANAALMDMLAGPKEVPAEEAEPPAQETKTAAAGPASVQAVFDHLPGAFQPQAAAGVDVVFQFSISGPGGGDWYAAIREGACDVQSGVHDRPTTTLKMSADDFVQYVSGKLPAMQAYSSGKLKIEGDLMKSQLVEKLFKF
jgi:putative sterol carrier protein